jgi:hypothetical protein
MDTLDSKTEMKSGWAPQPTYLLQGMTAPERSATVVADVVVSDIMLLDVIVIEVVASLAESMLFDIMLRYVVYELTTI